jgi:hypothetical protein
MKTKRIWLLALALTIGCAGVEEMASSLTGGNKTVVNIVYGSEKEEWLEPLVVEYNAALHRGASAAQISIGR